MSAFQALVYAILHAFGEFLPVSASAHRALPALVFGWPEASGVFLGALYLGTLLAVIIYFIHDWLSIASCFLQILIYRKRPMTLDERQPFFLALTAAPVGIAWFYLHDPLEQLGSSPYWTAGLLAAFTFPLWLADSRSRKNKGMFDWNWADALIIGITELVTLVPGCGRMEGSLWGAFSRNYNREVAAKFACFASLPVLAAATILHLRGFTLQSPSQEGLSWLSFAIAVVVSLLCGLLAIGGLMKALPRKGVRQYCGYRIFLAILIVGIALWRARH